MAKTIDEVKKAREDIKHMGRISHADYYDLRRRVEKLQKLVTLGVILAGTSLAFVLGFFIRSAFF